jgi:hypothetical protein
MVNYISFLVMEEQGYLSTDTKLQAGLLGNRGSVRDRVVRFIDIPLSADRIWGPPGLLCNGCREMFILQ